MNNPTNSLTKQDGGELQPISYATREELVKLLTKLLYQVTVEDDCEVRIAAEYRQADDPMSGFARVAVAASFQP